MEKLIPSQEFFQTAYPHTLDVCAHFGDYPNIKHRLIVWHRRARKTTTALNIMLAEAWGIENKVFNYVAPTFRQAKQIAWRDPNMLKKWLPKEALKKPFNESELVGEFTRGSVLNIGGADDPERWLGTGGYIWILDEFATMRNGKELYERIIYPIIKENGGYVFFLFTPKGRTHGWEYFQRASEDPQWQSWFMPVTESNVLSQSEIEEARRDMPDYLFRQEMMCEFLMEGGGVIKRVDEAVSGELEKPTQGQRYVMGVDLAKRQDFTVLTILNCATRHVDAFERFQKIDYSFQKEKIARLAKEYYNPLLIVDSTGVGDPIVDDLKRMGLNVRDEGFKFTGASKKQLIEKLILAIEDRRVTYPDIPTLTDELNDFDIDERGRYSAPEGLHDDCVISLALAIEGLGAEIYSAGEPKSSYQDYHSKFRGQDD